MKQHNLIDKAFFLKKTALFVDLDLDELLTLADKMESVSYKREEFIFRKGQEANHLYFVMSGEIEVDRGESPQLLRSKEFFGDEGIFNEKPRRYTARCNQEAKLLRMNRSNLLSIINRCPSVAIALLKRYTAV